jgi:hypothetical protein
MNAAGGEKWYPTSEVLAKVSDGTHQGVIDADFGLA